jgi:hypothetical protein
LKTEQAKSNRKWAIVIGLGLALSPIHNQWLTDLVTKDGIVGFFLPSFGYAVWIIATLVLVFVYDNWYKNEKNKWRFNWREIDWGDRILFIPLLVIVMAMGISGVVNGEAWNEKLSPLLMGITLFTLYLAARKLGAIIFRAFIPFVIAGAIIIVVFGLLNPGESTGGLITNYCASAGFLVFGAVVNRGRWQWALIAVALAGLFFIGALEAAFIVAVLGVVVIIRWDVNRRFLIVAGSMAFLIVLWSVLGHIAPLYMQNFNLDTLFYLVTGKVALNSYTVDLLTTYRWEVIVGALRNISLIGHGYYLGTATGNIVHNVPVIIIHQVGPLAAIAWTFVTVYCLIKTRWKYAWVAVIAMCLFDHYIWTQLAPYWWLLVGVSTSTSIKTDRIFKGDRK